MIMHHENSYVYYGFRHRIYILSVVAPILNIITPLLRVCMMVYGICFLDYPRSVLDHPLWSDDLLLYYFIYEYFYQLTFLRWNINLQLVIC